MPTIKQSIIIFAIFFWASGLLYSIAWIINGDYYENNSIFGGCDDACLEEAIKPLTNHIMQSPDVQGEK
jgi:hypothetical protein